MFYAWCCYSVDYILSCQENSNNPICPVAINDYRICSNMDVTLPEIPPPSRTEEEEGGEVWAGRIPHLCTN